MTPLFFKLAPFLALAGFALTAPTAFGPNAPDPWQNESIYQIVTDRFFNGDVANDNADGNYNAGAGQSVHGGDFKGLEQKLDYIKALGATAIWISPVVLNGNGDYHGYAGRDFYQTAPHFGSIADLKHMIDAAHGKGLKVIDDVVVNHGAQLLNSNDSGYPNFRVPGNYNLFYRDNRKQYAAPFGAAAGLSLGELFHNNGFIQDFNNATQTENGSLQGLDDFRTESAYLREQMANIYKFWISQAGFDAFRVDTVKHVEQGFWQSWSPQIREYAANNGKPDFFIFGEVYDGREEKVGSYTGTKGGGAFELDSVLDYPLYFSINGVFAHASAATKRVEDHYHAVDANYDAGARLRLVTFLDNHDQARFLNSANANDRMDRLNVALAFLYTARGLPCLYYGTEQGFDGGADPHNREDMFAGQYEQGPSAGDNFNETHPLFQLIAKLNNFRRLYPALHGEHVNLWNNPNGPGLLSYSRVLGPQEIFVVVNTATIPQTLPNRPTTYAPGSALVNLLDPSETIVITPNGQTPSLSVPGTTAKIYLQAAQVQPLDPVVTSIMPAHDAVNVPTPSKIVVTFSKAMETASVEAAFALSPGTNGTFTWSAGRDQVTFQTPAGLPELTTIALRIGESAFAADGTHLHAPFEARFATAAHTVQDVTRPAIAIISPRPGETVHGGINFYGNAQDDVGVQKVQMRVDDEPWQFVSWYGDATAVTFSQYYGTAWDLNGSHTLSARAIDAAGNISEQASVAVKFANVPPSFEQNLFAYGSPGWGEWGCGNQMLWSSDSPFGTWGEYGFIGGNTYRSSNAIPNVCSQEQFLYQSERYGSATDGFQYLFHCPPGLYQVDILEAETFMNGPNQRRFDIYANGEKVVQNFDIFLAAGGANLGVTKTFTVNVVNTLLDVQFKPVFDAPRMSAIHVKKIGDAASDPDGLADWWRLMYFGHANAAAEDNSRAQDDPDADGFTNAQESLAGTDPHDANARFCVDRVTDYGSEVDVYFYQVENRRYQLQRTDSLSSGKWSDVGTPRVAYWTGHWGSLWEYNAQAVPNPKFYRVVVVP